MVNLRQQSKVINKKKTNFRYCSPLFAQFASLLKLPEVVSEQRKAGWSFIFPAEQPGHCLRQWNVWNVNECPQRLADVATQHP